MKKLDYFTVLGAIATALLFVTNPEWFGNSGRVVAAAVLALAFLFVLGLMLYKNHTEHPTKGCLVLEDNGVQRFFTWRGRTDIHLVEKEESPKCTSSAETGEPHLI